MSASKKEAGGVAVSAGTTSGHVLLTALCCSGMWYLVDDRLAELIGVASLGTLPFGLVFVVLLMVCCVMSLAGMRWES